MEVQKKDFRGGRQICSNFNLKILNNKKINLGPYQVLKMNFRKLNNKKEYHELFLSA